MEYSLKYALIESCLKMEFLALLLETVHREYLDLRGLQKIGAPFSTNPIVRHRLWGQHEMEGFSFRHKMAGDRGSSKRGEDSRNTPHLCSEPSWCLR